MPEISEYKIPTKAPLIVDIITTNAGAPGHITATTTDRSKGT